MLAPSVSSLTNCVEEIVETMILAVFRNAEDFAHFLDDSGEHDASGGIDHHKAPVVARVKRRYR